MHTNSRHNCIEIEVALAEFTIKHALKLTIPFYGQYFVHYFIATGTKLYNNGYMYYTLRKGRLATMLLKQLSELDIQKSGC